MHWVKNKLTLKALYNWSLKLLNTFYLEAVAQSESSFFSSSYKVYFGSFWTFITAIILYERKYHEMALLPICGQNINLENKS